MTPLQTSTFHIIGTNPTSNMPPSLRDQYKPSLIGLMSFRDGVDYDKNYEFSPEELGTITPDEIVRWMSLKVYGTPDPEYDANPTEGRANSLTYYKKALSSFMPNRLMHWNELANPPVGNPTKSSQVNDLIKRVKKKEVRKQGKPTQARKAFEEKEFEQLIQMMEQYGDVEKRLFVSAVFRFQYAMIARIDDTAKFRLDDLKPNHQHSEFSILAKLCWSKNVNEERDAPDQILLGAMNPKFCVLLGFSTWFEFWIGHGHGNDTEFSFGIHGCTNPTLIKTKATNVLKGILDDDEFVCILEGKRGTHSIRKLATTRARKSGCTKDETDHRARWRHRRQQDAYADTVLQWPDARVAAALCNGGAIHYKTKPDSGITEDWILANVVPSTAARFERPISLVLGRALLWRCFDESESITVPEAIKNRVKAAYNDLGHRCQLTANENPIEKAPIIVTGHDAQVFIDLLLDDDDDENNNAETRPRRIRDEQLRHMNSLMIGLRRDNAELQGELRRRSEIQERMLRQVNRNVTHIMRHPLRRRMRLNEHNVIDRNIDNAVAVAEEEEASAALLSKCPKSLHTLWNEYEFGLANHKPAKDFNAVERGRVKHVYHRRKVVWDQVSEMVRSGWSAHEACNKIYDVYGANQTVTSITNQLRKDRNNGGHPALRVTQL